MDSQALPVMNSLNAPAELCEAVKARFLQFLNDYVAAESAEPEASQGSAGGLQRSAGRGGRAGGQPIPASLPAAAPDAALHALPLPQAAPRASPPTTTWSSWLRCRSAS